MNKEYTVTRTNWNGIEIEIRWNAEYLIYDDRSRMGHLEVRSVSPDRAPLPITDTGYRSYFTPRDRVDGFESPEAFVEAWLDYESHFPDWKRRDVANLQLTLL